SPALPTELTARGLRSLARGKVLSVVGNRPQFIKSGPVSEALRDAGIDEVVVHTGQHYDHGLSQVFFDELGLGEPRYRLEVGGLGGGGEAPVLGPGTGHGSV